MESSRRFSLILIPILVFSLFLFRACKSGSSLTQEEITTLTAEADSLKLAVDDGWVRMLQADDQMHYNCNTIIPV